MIMRYEPRKTDFDNGCPDARCSGSGWQILPYSGLLVRCPACIVARRPADPTFPPLVRGGQGRSHDDLSDSAQVLIWIALVAFLLGVSFWFRWWIA